jgi:3-methyladenine DNA glycosylase AlkD
MDMISEVMMHIQEAKMYKAIIRRAEDFLAARANPQNVMKYSRYFKEGYNAWGNSVEDIAEIASLIESEYSLKEPSQLIELGSLLFQHPKYEMGSLAIQLLERRLKKCGKKEFEGLRNWFDFGVNNWAHADHLCSRLLPRFLLKDIVALQDFAGWLKSGSRWSRRAVPVALIKLKKKYEIRELLEFTEELMIDPERVVHQGMGWFLRELWKIHPHDVEDFLYRYRNTAARLIIQYATEKLSKEERLRFRKDKALSNKEK